MNIRGKYFFTLSEVLIALTIIGVIAALVVPAVQNNTNKKEIETGLVKFYSMIKNVEMNSAVDNSSVESWPLIIGEGKTNFDTYYEPYLSYSRKMDCTSAGADPCRSFATYKLVNSSSTMYFGGTTAYFLNDGSILYSINSIVSSITYITLHIDVNGGKSPNQMGRDVFSFNLITLTKRNGIQPHYIGMNPTFVCSTGNTGYECSSLLARKSWTFPDNYPAW